MMDIFVIILIIMGAVQISTLILFIQYIPSILVRLENCEKRLEWHIKTDLSTNRTLMNKISKIDKKVKEKDKTNAK